MILIKYTFYLLNFFCAYGLLKRYLFFCVYGIFIFALMSYSRLVYPAAGYNNQLHPGRDYRVFLQSQDSVAETQ